MAGFVDCNTYNKDQGAQNEAIKTLAEKVDEQSTNIKSNKDAIKELGDSALTADSSIVDTSGDGNKITVEKLKAALKGKVSITVDPTSGLTGDGTSESPLKLNLGDMLKVGTDGSIDINKSKISEALGGVNLVDASGTVVLGKIQGLSKGVSRDG